MPHLNTPHALQRCAKDEIPDPSLKTALAVIRMAGWDSDVFFKFKQVRGGQRLAMCSNCALACRW
jgi:hypothetical protein